MLARLRRARLLALVFLLGVPGLGGTWLQALHPCPVDRPWAAEGAAQGAIGGGHGDGHAGAGAGAHDHGSSGESCECVDHCLAAFVASPAARTAIVAAPLDAWVVPVPPVRTAFLPADRPPHLRPPATAPPLA